MAPGEFYWCQRGRFIGEVPPAGSNLNKSETGAEKIP